MLQLKKSQEATSIMTVTTYHPVSLEYTNFTSTKKNRDCCGCGNIAIKPQREDTR